MYPIGWASFSEEDPNYWPAWEPHYQPMIRPRPRLHHRNLHAPPPYSMTAPYYHDPGPGSFGVYPPIPRRSLFNSTSPSPLPRLMNTADALMPPNLAANPLASNFELRRTNYPIPLNVRCEVKSTEATIIWDTPTFTCRAPRVFTYFVHVEGGDTVRSLEFANWKSRMTISLIPGNYYAATVEAVAHDKLVVARGKADFKAVFDAHELGETFNLALAYLKPLNDQCSQRGYQQFQVFYRNKPTSYFNQVRIRDHGIMIKYRKDDNGHPASPINGEIDGLFFNARQPGGKMPTHSPFGNVRISIPAEYLFKPEFNLYFADFYCNNSTHYVTVVCCLPGSSTDKYCSRLLMPLDSTNNPFLYVHVNPYTGDLEHYINGSIWVEFYYTEDVPISWGCFDTVHSTGQSKPNGVPNNKSCTICNLYPWPSSSSSPLPLLPSPAGSIGRKRRASSIGADEPPKRPCLLPAPVSAKDFERPVENANSTFISAMDSQRKETDSEGRRLECADPAIIFAVCKIMADVVTEIEGKITEELTVKNEQKDNERGSQMNSSTAAIPDQPPSAPDQPTSAALMDPEYIQQKEALSSFRIRKDRLAQLMKNAEHLLNDAKKMAEEMCRKISKIQ